MSQDELTVVNGWALYGHPVFLDRLEGLVAEVESVAAKDDSDVEHHPAWKLLDCVDRSMRERVPRDPGHKEFKQGKTLGKDLVHWHRVKRGMPQRYRLFFQYRSEAPLTIIFAWLNDDYSLRKEGSKTDCYAVFKRMVESGSIPNSYPDLLLAATAIPAR